ncbi:MAG: hypothetical protein FWH56_12975 [Betaproteobacteria bacterium]|nr:hypothetical protein [Betaproteobacteria bacterium]
MKKTILLLFVSICGLLPLQANAITVMFGADETIHLFDGIKVSSPSISSTRSPRLPGYLAYQKRLGSDDEGHRHLGHLVRTESFILPYSVKSMGYVFSTPGSSWYTSVSEAQLKTLQNEGRLPKTLPPIKLTFFEYLFGNLLWIALALLVVPPIWRMVKGTEESEEIHDPDTT